MAKKEKKEQEVIEKAAPVKDEKPLKKEKVKKEKKEVVVEEQRPAFETREDLKKLYLYTVIVPSGQGEYIMRMFKANRTSVQFLQFGEGTASNAIRDILGIEDTKKDIVYSIVREDAIPDIKKEIDVYFIASKKNRGIAFTVALASIVGVKMYKFLTQTVRG